MLTAIIRSEAGPEALVCTLAPLVRGVVEGLVGEVLIAGLDGDTETPRVAEASGAVWVSARSWSLGLNHCLVRAKHPILLCMESGTILGEAFWSELADRLRSSSGPMVFVTKPDGEALLARLSQIIRARPGRTQAVVSTASALTGDPWQGGLASRPVQMRAVTYRLGR